MDLINFFFRETPKITIIVSFLCIGVSLTGWFGVLAPSNFHFSFELAVYKFQLWRFISTFFYFDAFNNNFLFHIVLLLRNSKLLEKSIFKGSSPDFIHFLLVTMSFLIMLSPLIKLPFLSYSLSFAVTYYWGRKNKTQVVQFLGIFSLKAPYLPWIYLGFSFLLESEFRSNIWGIVVGHLFFYFKDVFPRSNMTKGLNPLKTPLFMKLFCDRLNLNNDFFIEAEDDGILF